MGDNSAGQCGYCTSGMCMTMYGLLKKDATPAKQVIEDAFDGNICRCTGYRVTASYHDNDIPYTFEDDDIGDIEYNAIICSR